MKRISPCDAFARCDFTVKFDNKSFPISSRTFNVYSNRFWRLLRNSELSPNESSIPIEAKVKRWSLINFIQAYHNQEYPVMPSNVHDLQLLCREWEVDGVLQFAKDFIKNPSNLHDLLILSILFSVEYGEETSEFEDSVVVPFAEFIDDDSIF
jgi:hypothetical protein